MTIEPKVNSAFLEQIEIKAQETWNTHLTTTLSGKILSFCLKFDFIRNIAIQLLGPSPTELISDHLDEKLKSLIFRRITNPTASDWHASRIAQDILIGPKDYKTLDLTNIHNLTSHQLGEALLLNPDSTNLKLPALDKENLKESLAIISKHAPLEELTFTNLPPEEVTLEKESNFIKMVDQLNNLTRINFPLEIMSNPDLVQALFQYPEKAIFYSVSINSEKISRSVLDQFENQLSSNNGLILDLSLEEFIFADKFLEILDAVSDQVEQGKLELRLPENFELLIPNELDQQQADDLLADLISRYPQALKKYDLDSLQRYIGDKSAEAIKNSSPLNMPKYYLKQAKAIVRGTDIETLLVNIEKRLGPQRAFKALLDVLLKRELLSVSDYQSLPPLRLLEKCPKNPIKTILPEEIIGEIFKHKNSRELDEIKSEASDFESIVETTKHKRTHLDLRSYGYMERSELKQILLEHPNTKEIYLPIDNIRTDFFQILDKHTPLEGLFFEQQLSFKTIKKENRLRNCVNLRATNLCFDNPKAFKHLPLEEVGINDAISGIKTLKAFPNLKKIHYLSNFQTSTAFILALGNHPNNTYLYDEIAFTDGADLDDEDLANFMERSTHLKKLTLSDSIVIGPKSLEVLASNPKLLDILDANMDLNLYEGKLSEKEILYILSRPHLRNIILPKNIQLTDLIIKKANERGNVTFPNN